MSQSFSVLCCKLKAELLTEGMLTKQSLDKVISYIRPL